MDLSINNIYLNKKDNINFKGLMGEYNKNTTPVYKFTAPPHKKNEKVILELSFLEENKKTAQFYKSENARVLSFEFPCDEKDGIYVNEQTLEIPQEALNAKCKAFGYRYKIVDKKGDYHYELDPFRSIKIAGEGKDASERMNVIEVGRFYGISPKGGTMRHSFLDSDVRLGEDGKKAELNADFVRNHFNKLGGSIAGLNWLLKNTNELAPYRYFMTTPDIGADKISSHRYWPANQYQCSDLETFKDFNFKLFEQGKGYVADGAFTSQGIQSPLVQHVLKWGKESPFYHWLKVDGIPSLGVLPDVSEVGDVNPYKHIGVRLVNGKGEGYDKTKPTYIQFYDKRLLSDEKRDSNELVFDYDKNDVEDIYEITSHQDSIQPYAFEIDPNDKKLKIFNGGNTILLSEIEKAGQLEEFLTFPNFKLVEKNKAGGATCWDGNVDIIKMNLSNPKNNPENIQGYRDAREYLINVASYWTRTIQAHLILQSAIAGKEKMQEFANKNGIDNNRIREISKSIANNEFVSSIKNEDSKTLIKQFPLQSLETSEELSAIFTQKEFSQELFTNDTLEKIARKFDRVIERVALPGDAGQYQAYIKRAYGDEILRYIFVSALAPEAIENGTINLDKLKQVTLKSFQTYKPNSVQEERKQVVSKIQKGLDSINLEKLTSKILNEISLVSLEDFKMAEAVVLQGKGGLNWRFDAAKDIGDLDAVRNGEEFNKIWNGSEEFPGVQQFWGDFVERIRKYNPAAYVINEVTTLGDFYQWKNEVSMRRFDQQLANAYYEMSEEEQNNYENHVPYAKQVQFLNQTNSTTTSEYDKGFNKFSEFAGVNPEQTVYAGSYSGTVQKAGDLSVLKQAADSLMKYNQPNSAIFSHMFVSNHDKPSVLHTMPLNMSIFMAENLEKSIEELNKNDKNLVAKLIGKNPNYSLVCPKAVGVGLAMSKTIEKLKTNPPKGISKITPEQAQKLEEQLILLVNGQKTSTSEPSFKRAEAFGVKPYEITIKDLIKKSGIAADENSLNELTKDFHYTMLEDSMNYFQRLWQVMNAYVGVPTLYGGNEFAQTGYETPSKNVYLGIRNEILHDLQNDPRYKEYFEKMQKTSNLHNNPRLSALRDGTPVSCQIINTDKNIQIWPVIKKNDKNSQTISLITNLGMPYKQASCEGKTSTLDTYSVESIALNDNTGKHPFEVPAGYALKKVGDNRTYKIDEKGCIVATDGKDIILDDTVSTFYIEKMGKNPTYRTV